MAALALPAVPALAGPPASTVPGGFASRHDLYAYQDRLDMAAQRIAAVDGHDTASIVANPADHRLRVYWPGEGPAPVRALAARLDVPVTFLPAAYSHRELVAEAQRLATSGQVIQAAPEADGRGLAVTVAAGQLQPNAEAGLRAATRLPLTITSGQAPR